MSILAEYAKIRAKLDSAIDTTLAGEVADGMKRAVQKSVRENVYDAYSPTDYIRRGAAGGLADESNYITSLTGAHELTLENTSSDDDYSGMGDRRITEIVESGDGYTWFSPGARPFMDKALEEYVNTGSADSDLKQGLIARGFSD